MFSARSRVFNSALKMAPRLSTSSIHFRLLSTLGPRPLLATTSAKIVSVQMANFMAIRLYSSGKDYPKHMKVLMPALSPTMTSGNIGHWKKKIGEAVAPGDVLAEIETDKAQMDFENQEEGFLAKILLPDGSKDVPINTPIGIIVEKESDVASFSDYSVTGAAKPAAAAAAPAAASPATPSSAPAASPPIASQPQQATASSDRLKASPLAKSISKELGIDLTGVKGTGPSGRIVKADVQSLASSGATKPAPSAPLAAPSPSAAASFVDLPLTNMRKIIATRLSESKQNIPHYYLTTEINMDKVMEVRTKLNANAKDHKISVNDFIIKACALALRDMPEVNSSWGGEFIRRYENVDVSVAVATEAGLITPIVHNAHHKGLLQISKQAKALADKAKANKLAPHEYQGGTFTVSNLGMFGIKHFTAIINPPQSCILAVGGSEKRLVPSKCEKGFQTSDIMAVTLSCDHRVIDGALGAKFLSVVKTYLEQPIKMIL